MKIAIQCQSPLLQRSLELFLKDYLSLPRSSDIIIRDRAIIDDEKRTLTIGNFENSDLKKPFSKAQLIYRLEQILNHKEPVAPSDKTLDFSLLEEHIEKLTQQYKADILKAIKRFL